MKITFAIANEYTIDSSTRQVISQLFQECFSGYPTRRAHFRQVPSFRLLAYQEAQLVGHIAVTYRWMHLGATVIKVLGLGDVCVASAARHHQLATRMIAQLETLAQQQEVDFLLLIAWKPEVYEKMGFQHANNPCRWLLIQQDQSLGIAQRSLKDALMVKATGTQQWSDSTLDFLGPIF